MKSLDLSTVTETVDDKGSRFLDVVHFLDFYQGRRPEAFIEDVKAGRLSPFSIEKIFYGVLKRIEGEPEMFKGIGPYLYQGVLTGGEYDFWCTERKAEVLDEMKLSQIFENVKIGKECSPTWEYNGVEYTTRSRYFSNRINTVIYTVKNYDFASLYISFFIARLFNEIFTLYRSGDIKTAFAYFLFHIVPSAIHLTYAREMEIYDEGGYIAETARIIKTAIAKKLGVQIKARVPFLYFYIERETFNVPTGVKQVFINSVLWLIHEALSRFEGGSKLEYTRLFDDFLGIATTKYALRGESASVLLGKSVGQIAGRRFRNLPDIVSSIIKFLMNEEALQEIILETAFREFNTFREITLEKAGVTYTFNERDKLIEALLCFYIPVNYDEIVRFIDEYMTSRLGRKTSLDALVRERGKTTEERVVLYGVLDALTGGTFKTETHPVITLDVVEIAFALYFASGFRDTFWQASESRRVQLYKFFGTPARKALIRTLGAEGQQNGEEILLEESGKFLDKYQNFIFSRVVPLVEDVTYLQNPYKGTFEETPGFYKYHITKKKFPKYRRQTWKDGVIAEYGIERGTSTLRAVLFSKDKFTKAKARTWLKEHDFIKNPHPRSSRRTSYYKYITDGKKCKGLSIMFISPGVKVEFDEHNGKRHVHSISFDTSRFSRKRSKELLPKYYTNVKRYLRENPDTEVVIMMFYDKGALEIQVTQRDKVIETFSISRQKDEELFNILYGIYLLREEPDVKGAPLSIDEYRAIKDRNLDSLRPFLGKFFRHVRFAKDDTRIREIVDKAKVHHEPEESSGIVI